MLKKLVFTIALMSSGISAFSQEWGYIHSHDYEGNKFISFVDAEELDSSDFLLYALHSYAKDDGDYYSYHPALLRLSPNGEVLAEKRFFKSGYWGEPPFVFEKDDGFIAIASYSPDRDDTSSNYNPEVQDGILAYYKLDADLNILDSVDYHIRLDTVLDYTWWQYTPNETNPLIHPISVIEDETGIVGVYNKISSLDYEIPYSPQHHDTLTFFRMNYDGEIIHSNAISAGGTATGNSYLARRHHLFRTDTGYTMYGIKMQRGAQAWQGDGPVLYFDEDFNFIRQSFLSHQFYVPLTDFRAKRTSKNIVYITCERDSLHGESNNDARIMKVYDDFNTLQVKNYTDRGTSKYGIGRKCLVIL